jgi:histidyl-tRNA synthetase
MLPKGTRDLLPDDMAKRKYIVHAITKVFEQHAFQQIETPAIELNKTLSGKYGEEGDRLMFKVLPRGEKLNSWANQSLEYIKSNIEEALRYDLTVPFARMVVDQRNNINLPFKRYQIQNVWRADRPQKGRFREFTQCDADVVGPAGIIQEAELLHIYYRSFQELNLPVEIRLNHRSLLQGLAELADASDKLTAFTIGLDKLDKVGWDGVEKEWKLAGINELNPEVKKLLQTKGTLEQQLPLLEEALKSVSSAQRGLAELNQLKSILASSPLENTNLLIDLSLARGLNYYTGCIFEVSALGAEMGSIGGGGRYDDLTGIFGWKDLSGVGISFGLDRIQLVMDQLDLFPKEIGLNAEVLFAYMDEESSLVGFKLAQELRSLGMRCEVYPAAAKMKKQIDFAVKSKIPFLIILGEKERMNKQVTWRNLETGEQETISQTDLYKKFD